MSTKYIERLLQEAYSDKNLVDLLAHLDAGRLSYYSCCCLRGIPNAPHALLGAEYGSYHMLVSNVAFLADREFHELGMDENGGSDELRRERLRPLVLAEMERREQERDYEGEEEPWSDSQGMIAMVNSIKGR